MVLKINVKELLVEVEEEFAEEISIEDLVMELPDTNPRYVLYSYKYTHSDGRTSYPLCMIYYVPRGIRTSLNMLYASTKPVLVQEFSLMKV
eukprot:CAMPEP_0177685134 /NCGR_PEP_ID=MMETSP0447-20121125/32844_1 /TAXON_ID=0 /ORGANISM="Stygamoeba regulata, Strain BSH-02190019" /LENGTH=90 /DNA_ID=CAMNT_0019195111 /DNA_START=143 /DNA_END=411 /DNA_ORIENTATION=+